MRHPAANLDGSLEATLRLCDIPQETQGIEEIGFAARVGTDDEAAPLEGHTD